MMNEIQNQIAESQAMFQEGKRRESWGSYWDTFTYAQNATMDREIRLFETKKSGSKGLELTNMTKDGELPAGSEIDVDCIKFLFLGTWHEDITAIMKAYGVTVLYGGIKVFEGTMDQCPGGGTQFSGVAATTASTTTIVQSSATNGPGHGFKLAMPWLLYFTSGPKIEVILNTTSPPTLKATAAYGTGAFCRMYFEGLRRDLA